MDSDIGKKADTEKNLCYYDIARILRDEDICDSIDERLSYSIAVSGSAVTKEMCYNDVDKLKQLTPEEYYSDENRRNNICIVYLILPLLVLAAFIQKEYP